ncbi:hypothetical protein Q8O96_30930 [Pseudomonas sp. LPH60]|uniref:hypothetical protein n=1 Tax=Pseudomonas sp. LPH60 TaxID=3065906 RepID=UPI00273B251D|nr:hypothetical protein [Pseudomonas sp. LPH60]MDP4573488.1 hypothetical protein [Pseudomonas sp. LPH60]
MKELSGKLALAKDVALHCEKNCQEGSTYEQVHGLSFEGEARFIAFLGEFAAVDINADLCRMSFLGVIEDNLNAEIALPLQWELSALLSSDRKPHTYLAEIDDFIIESVSPGDEHEAEKWKA